MDPFSLIFFVTFIFGGFYLSSIFLKQEWSKFLPNHPPNNCSNFQTNKRMKKHKKTWNLKKEIFKVVQTKLILYLYFISLKIILNIILANGILHNIYQNVNDESNNVRHHLSLKHVWKIANRLLIVYMGDLWSWKFSW